ncbi:hypothetical protein RJ639_010026 [Escallonia herrerae]|uniref:Ionotropic glutamate receptor C-terminal domain-containing protein n=1 Tax=Escallonia herrerae TaxID=1293975 RepID=A0AA88VQM4_9ASTE|nr:hypothetical protein RJ639_010026 [Escallonia herrerae]
MPVQLNIFSTAAKRFPFLLISFLLILYHAPNLVAAVRTINIGAILDVGSRAGKEQKAALTVAVRNFNGNSEKHKLAIHFANSTGEPLQATYAAKHLVEEKQVKLIAGMQTWQEATLVADVGKQAQVPVLSFSAAAITPPLTQLRWPYLLQMATNSSAEMNCIAAIVQSFNWRRVIAIYEDDMSGSESGMLALLSEALQSVGSEIEHLVLLPPSSSLSDPKEIVRDEIAMLLSKQSRVFIVLKSSLPLATHLFKEAKKIGLMGQESAWIVSDAVSSLLDSVHTSLISSMEGALGIKTYYSEETTGFSHFKAQFREIFRLEYMQEDNLEPGIHALRAYDSITAISQTLKALGSDSTNLSKNLLEGISSSNFTGFSGDIRFLDGKLSEPPIYRIVNIGGKRYRELKFWSSKFGFSCNLNFEQIGKNRLSPSLIIWPGDLVARVPKGWTMPTAMKKMRIGVPNGSFFDKFVKVELNDSSKKPYDGFCIEVFEEVVRILEQNYSFPYDFISFDGTYGELIDSVINKTFDAVVGDVTILANRSLYVEFTQPFAESGLSMLVPVKSEAHKAWMFFKPLSLDMWVATFGILSYTMFVVWFFEHQTKNREFEGPWKDQLATAMWFIFSSLFYAHREKIQSNYTKVVVIAWLFLVMVLTSSYTASLSSMLTVQKLEPKVKDIDWIRRTNATVACDGDTFVLDYLQRVLRLNNITSVVNPHDYPKEFDSGSIAAAFLELPYERVFRQEYCNRYIITGPTYRFGGFGFVFQKGSPIAADVSEAILIMSEDGRLKEIEKKWLRPSKNCSSDTTSGTDSLSLKSFWGLYLISGVPSTVCFLVFLVRLPKSTGKVTSRGTSFWSKTVELVRSHSNVGNRSLGRVAPDTNQRGSAEWELISPSELAPEALEALRPTQLEIPIKCVCFFNVDTTCAILFTRRIFLMNFLLILSHHGTAIATQKTTSIGAIINTSTRVGKEVKVAMRIAARNFNNSSEHHKVALHFGDPSGDPLQSAFAAEQLIKEKGVQAIIGMETWAATSLVARIGNQTQVPVIALASAATTTPSTAKQWPFLVQMASNVTEQIRCIAAITGSFNWRKVIPIYEVDTYGGDSGAFAALAEALQDVGVEIEYCLAFPPFSSLSDPKGFICEEVAKLTRKQSRVFLILHSSLLLSTYLFAEANKLGLTEYREEDSSEMGIHALRAHDGIVALTRAIKKSSSYRTTTTMLLKTILSEDFTGLSGQIHFNGGELSQSSFYTIVNVVGKRYKDLGFWSSKFGFSKTLVRGENGGKYEDDGMEVLGGSVNWPGDLKRVPKRWSMPTDANPMKFGVPNITSFEKFVKVAWKPGSNERNYSGFFTDVFKEARQILEQIYPLPYELIPYNDTYDELVNRVTDKTFDGVIGNVTILASRSKNMGFMQPFVESGLTLISAVTYHTDNPWILFKPFTTEMWGVTGAIMIYTVLIVWLLERQSNPEFGARWQNQLSTAFWFTSSSLFFAHREQIHNNYARVVVSVWLFVVLALSSSYSASLSSMLAAPRLQMNVTDIGWLKKNNTTVGCDGYSFVRNYLEYVLKFDPANIKDINSEYDYHSEFQSGNITAAFLEIPYEKAFLNHQCKGYIVAGTSSRYGGDRFGGLGFVFQKGSPLATDVSQAILTLLENGRLKELEIQWFAPSADCLTSKTPDKTDSLSWHGFGGLSLLCCHFYHLFPSERRSPGSDGRRYSPYCSAVAHAPIYQSSGLLLQSQIKVLCLQLEPKTLSIIRESAKLRKAAY